MFTRVAIMSQPGIELRDLRAQFRNPLRYTVDEYVSLEEVKRGLSSGYDVLIMRFGSFQEAHVERIQKIRGLLPKPGLITVAHSIDPRARFALRDVVRHKILLEPVETGDLVSLVEKFSRGDMNPLRLHPRVSRDGDAEIYDPHRRVRLRARFVNFAQMGARLILQATTPLPKRSRVQLTYRSSTNPDYVHRIESVIVWEELVSGMFGTIVNGPQQMVGIRFIAAL